MNAIPPHHVAEPAFASSVFFIPTNRDCSRAATSYLAELDFARERAGRSIPLVVSETDRGPSVRTNAETLAELARENPDQRIHHLTLDLQHAYFDALLRDEPDVVKDMFRSPRRNYGTAMNKLFLMTASFGADALHRRDSDTRLLREEVPEAAGALPIEVELAYLGRRVGDVDAARPEGHGAAVDDAPVCVVGGNYFGEWNLDVKDFAARSYGIVNRLYEILGFDPEDVPALVEEVFPAEQVYDGRDERTLRLAPNEGADPDCGNVAVTRIHELLPSVPSDNNLAVDYFGFDLAMALGIPALHHTRAVFHEYHSGRFVPEQKQLYWEGIARFADYFNSYGPLYEPGAVGRADAAAPQLIPAELRAAIGRAVGALPGADPAGRAARITALANEILIPFDERYARIGRHLAENAERYVREVDEDYATHRLLLDRWPGIIERAKSLDLSEIAPALRG
ncbi:DUF6271 family protein [Streptomyces marincola]|uniref:DUF6271 family protein n=1 Tax=Streptomyces marincola TaxID=2878388 RepID=UPI001CF56844|nr:DUF6271 family protein [Streptomyces marincola]UCM87953.1 DUF6271 family protein [Streptomyces marincola]